MCTYMYSMSAIYTRCPQIENVENSAGIASKFQKEKLLRVYDSISLDISYTIP